MTALARVGAAITNYHKPDGSKQKELFSLTILEGSQVALVVKNPPANARDVRDMGSVPGLGRSPRGGHATCSSILAWRIPWTEEPRRLQSLGSHTVGPDWRDLAFWKPEVQNQDTTLLRKALRAESILASSSFRKSRCSGSWLYLSCLCLCLSMGFVSLSVFLSSFEYLVW